MTNYFKRWTEMLETLSQMTFDESGNLLVAGAFDITGLKPKGPWDASGGTYPTPDDIGDFWWISVAGTIGGIDYNVHDWLVYVDDSGVPADDWKKIDNTDIVTSVDGQVGDVELDGIYQAIVDTPIKAIVLSVLNAPPVSPVTDKWYAIGATPSGVWIGHPGELAKHNGLTWSYVIPTDGDVIYALSVITPINATKRFMISDRGNVYWYPLEKYFKHGDISNLQWSLAGHTMDTDLDMNGQRITGMDEPDDEEDAATKNYVDEHIETDAIHKSIVAEINSLTEKTVPIDADIFLGENSIGVQPNTWAKIKVSWANIKATLDTHFDGVYSALGHVHTHASTTFKTADDHHNKSHAHNGVDGSGTVAYSDLTGKPIVFKADVTLAGVSPVYADISAIWADGDRGLGIGTGGREFLMVRRGVAVKFVELS